MTVKINPHVPEEQVSNAEDTQHSLSGQDAVSEPDAKTEEETPKAAPVKVKKVKPAVAKEAVSEPEEPVTAPGTDETEVALPEPKKPAKRTAAKSAGGAKEVEPEEPSAAHVPEPAADGGPEEGADTRQVDFSDEDAALAGNAPEFDLGDEAEEEADHNHDGFDVAGKSKGELLDMFAGLLAEKPVQSIRREVEAIKIAFYKLHRAQVDALRKQFTDAGGNAEEFVAAEDAQEQRLKDLFAEYRKRRDDYMANIERSKEDNLRVKLGIIEELKELVNSSETLNNTFNTFRELQQRWKDAGPVPQADVKDLWETYNLHVENFYNFIKINKELRDLDLKRNYEAKMALCEEAEALILEPSVVNAFHKLQKLHEQWRETGPVANEYKETLWERFREASSRINKQHQEYFERLKDEQKANLDLKTELCVKTEELSEGVYTSRKDWNRASDNLLEIQKVWKTIGFAPKKDNAKIYERFRNACDRFFEQKRGFYMNVKTEMDHNLQLKTEICEAAESLQDSEDWKKTTDEIISLQKKWKETGPVARRHSDAVWKRFRSACDRFFERKSAHFSNKDSEYEKNLLQKRELLVEIEKSDVTAGGFEMIKDFQRRWSEIGFVPIKHKDAVQKEYKAVMDKLFAVLRGSDHTRQMDRFKGKVQSMKESGDRRLKFERERLFNKVRQLESDIATLENNIGFFSKSKNAEAMIKDVRDKIDRSRREMKETIEKINLIDNQQ